VTGLFDSLFLRLKIALITGVIASSPLWMYQLWAFIAPGLYNRERRWAYFFAGSAIPLFALGGGIAYFAMTKGLRFLIALVPNNVVPIITINTYLGYAIAMLLIFGLAFELPLVLILLNLAGVLSRRYSRPAPIRSACSCSRCPAWSWSSSPRCSPGRTTGAGPGGCRPTRASRRRSSWTLTSTTNPATTPTSAGSRSWPGGRAA
jgi:hypothetical protein